MIKYECSNGERVSEATIQRRLSETYREKYSGRSFVVCEGCGGRAQGSSHIVSQKRCKQLKRADLVYNPENFTPACNQCNSRWEGNDTTLMNYEECMEIMKKYDMEGYLKRINL